MHSEAFVIADGIAPHSSLLLPHTAIDLFSHDGSVLPGAQA